MTEQSQATLLTLDAESEDYYADVQLAGLIVLQSDEVMEHELRQWLPDTIRLLHSRVANDNVVNPDTLEAMAQLLPASTALLPPGLPFDVIAYGCTSGSTVIGEARVEALIQSVYPDVAVTNPLTAVKARLSALQARRVAMITPYEPTVTSAMQANLVDSGFDIVAVASFFEERDDRVCRISQASLRNAINSVQKDVGADAVFLSCTNLRTHGLLEPLQAELDVPLVSSNSALAWHICELVR